MINSYSSSSTTRPSPPICSVVGRSDMTCRVPVPVEAKYIDGAWACEDDEDEVDVDEDGDGDEDVGREMTDGNSGSGGVGSGDVLEVEGRGVLVEDGRGVGRVVRIL